MLCLIIVSYNSHQHIGHCLRSVFNSTLSSSVKVLVIDNASEDQGQTKQVLAQFPSDQIVWLENDTNVGFAAAVNQGLVYAKKNYPDSNYLLLNPDAALKPDCLEKMVQRAQASPAAGLLSATIMNPADQSVWFSTGHIRWLAMKTEHATSPSSLSSSQASNYLTGCCLFIKKEVPNKIGMLDERFFLYYEDADFCLRAQQSGFQITTVEDAICYHQESQSSSSDTKNYHLCLSGLKFFHKHYPRHLRPYFWLKFAGRYVYHKYLSGKSEVFRALDDFWRSVK